MKMPIKRRCPKCGTDLELYLGRCWNCDLKLHTPKDCDGCINLRGVGSCKAFNYKEDPILKEDGTCNAYEKSPLSDSADKGR